MRRLYQRKRHGDFPRPLSNPALSLPTRTACITISAGGPDQCSLLVQGFPLAAQRGLTWAFQSSGGSSNGKCSQTGP